MKKMFVPMIILACCLVVITPSFAMPMGNPTATLSNPMPGCITSVTFTADLARTHAPKAMSGYVLTSKPYGALPYGFAFWNAALASVSPALGNVANWQSNFTEIFKFSMTYPAQMSINAGTRISFTIDGFVNPPITHMGSPTPGATSTTLGELDTGIYYVHLYTYDEISMTTAHQKDDAWFELRVTRNNDLGDKFIVTKVVDPNPLAGHTPYFIVQKQDETGKAPMAYMVHSVDPVYQPAVGDRIQITGSYNAGSIRSIYAPYIVRAATNQPLPKDYAATNRTIVDSEDGLGAGLRFTTWGTIHKPSPSEDLNGYHVLYLDDGSGVTWPGTTNKSLRLLTSSQAKYDSLADGSRAVLKITSDPAINACWID